MTPAEAQSTSERILDAAEALFAERGFAGTSVRDIAGRVGLNQASIYNHFSSKQALYEAVLDRGLRPLAEILGAAAHDAFSRQASDRAGELIAEQLWRTPNLPKLLQREVLDNGEYLERLIRNWLRPIYEKGLVAIESGSRPDLWDEHERVLLLFAFYHLVFGHFTSAALIRSLGGLDLSSADVHGTYIAFLRKVSHRLLGIDAPPEQKKERAR
ncbi:MAG TPA: TetR/AcrR family transcriptional regulator [Candidatus Bathyarchaeia archaeon]|nr:TetR/AcrR family transcriptional regulator [Candidatus Bathyarchaeia archaeon]